MNEAWPPNPYLDAFLRSEEGQRYLEKNSVLEQWKRRRLLDEVETTETTAPETRPKDEWLEF